MKNQPKSIRKFSTAFKLEKVDLLDNGKITVKELSEIYDVSPTAIYKWKKKFSRLEKSERVVVEKISEERKNIELLHRIKVLEHIVGKKQLELDYYKTAIDVLSQEQGGRSFKKVQTRVMENLYMQGYSLTTVCDLLGISRQSYYKRLQKQNVKGVLFHSLEQIVLKNRQSKSRAGLRTIYYKEKLSSLLGVNQFEQQMSARGFALKPYRSYIKTTDSRGHHFKFDNLIAGIDISRENQVIVGDITYYQCTSGLYYIFQFQDYYTLEIKGLVGNRNMEGVNAERCLRQVFNYNKQRMYKHLLILHTDKGSQYRSHNFQQMLKVAQIRPSHARNCFENGLSERANGIVKNEYLIDYNIQNTNHLNTVLNKIKYQVNEVWPSKTLGYITPKEFAKWTREMKNNERPIKTVKLVQ